jgi:hypothetical protein
MNRTIHKFTFEIADDFSVRIPEGARLLSVQVQHDIPQIWALVNTEAPNVIRRFALRGTGHDCEGLASADFVGTFQLGCGALVFHLFDRGEL